MTNDEKLIRMQDSVGKLNEYKTIVSDMEAGIIALASEVTSKLIEEVSGLGLGIEYASHSSYCAHFRHPVYRDIELTVTLRADGLGFIVQTQGYAKLKYGVCDGTDMYLCVTANHFRDSAGERYTHPVQLGSLAEVLGYMDGWVSGIGSFSESTWEDILDNGANTVLPYVDLHTGKFLRNGRDVLEVVKLDPVYYAGHLDLVSGMGSLLGAHGAYRDERSGALLLVIAGLVGRWYTTGCM